jgi:hypothetical protein
MKQPLRKLSHADPWNDHFVLRHGYPVGKSITFAVIITKALVLIQSLGVYPADVKFK